MRKLLIVVLTPTLLAGFILPAFSYTFIWPEFRANNFRSGQAPSDIFGPENPVLAWSWSSGARLGIPVVGEYGKAFVGTEDGVVVGIRSGGT